MRVLLLFVGAAVLVSGYAKRCPTIRSGTVGICLQECNPKSTVNTCRDGKICCSNGCGNVCTEPVDSSDRGSVGGGQTPRRPQPRGGESGGDSERGRRPPPGAMGQEKCYGGTPIKDASGAEIFCGRGPGRQNCEGDNECHIHPTDGFAVCCTKEDMDRGRAQQGGGLPSIGLPGGEDLENMEKCFGGTPVKDGESGAEIFCGIGQGSQECPDGTKCHRHPTGEFAVCCNEEDLEKEIFGGDRPPIRLPGMGGEGGCSSDDIPQDLMDILKEIAAGTKTFADILDKVDDIPQACLRRLSASIPEGTCQIEEVKKTICDEQGDVEVAPALLRCLAKDDICALLIDLMTSEGEGCIDPEYIGYYSEQITKHSCPVRELPNVAFLFLNKDLLEERLKDMSLNDLVSFLASIKDEELLLQGARCDKIETIGASIEEKMKSSSLTLEFVLSNGLLTMDVLMDFLPYLPEGLCSSIPESAFEDVNLELLGKIPFMCGDQDKDFEEAMKGVWEMLGGDSTGSSTGMRPSTEEREKMMKWKHRLEMDREGGPRCDFPCGRIIAQKLTSGDNPIINLESEDDRENLGNVAKCLAKDKVIEAARPGKCAGLSPDVLPTSRRDLERLMRRCRPEVGDRNMTKDEVESMGCAAVGMSGRDLKKIPHEVLKETLSKLKDCLEEADSDFLEKLAKQFEANLTKDDVVKLGKAAGRIAREKLRELDDALNDPAVLTTVKDSIEDMKKRRDPGVMGRAHDIASKVTDLKNIAHSKVIMGAVPLIRLTDEMKKIGGSAADAIKQLLGLNDAFAELQTTFSQSRFIVKNLLGDKKPKDLTEEDIEQLKGKLIAGISSEDIEGMKESKDKLKLLKALCRKQGLDGQQVEAIKTLTEESFSDYNATNPFAEFQPSHAQAFSPRCLVKLGKEALNNMSDTACAEVCARKGRDSKLMCFVGREEIEESVEACLECLGKASANSGDLSEDDVDVLGKLLLSAPKQVIDRIPAEVAARKAKMFKRRCTLKRVRDAIKSKLKKAIEDGTLVSEEILATAGSYAVLDISNNPEEKPRQFSTEPLEEELRPPQDEDEAKELECCRNMNSDEQNAQVDQEETKLSEELARNVESAANSNRKRRSATPHTCASIKDMGAAALTLTALEIEQITSENFLDCLFTLGSVKGWSSEQGTALLAALKKAAGIDSLCSLSSDHLKDLRMIAYHLSVDEIKCLENIDENIVTNLGDESMDMWPQEKAAEFAKKFMSFSNVASTGGLSSTHLTVLGHFVCGFPADEIKQINPNYYATAISSLGQSLKACPRDRLSALAHVAKQPEAHGPVSGWDASVFRENGIVIAGLSGYELNMASAEDVEGWSTDAIKHIPGSELKKLDPANLEAFSYEQRLAITKEALAELGDDQKNAIGVDGDGNNKDKGNNSTGGAGLVKYSVLAIVLSFVMLLL